MIKKILKAFLPPILITLIKRIHPKSADELFEGDDALFKIEVQKVTTYGEYGCGKSTTWVLNNTKATVISVDTSKVWISAVRKNVNDSRLKLHHSDLGPLGAWGRPLNYDKSADFQDYTDYIWQQEICPELVLVDGRFRVCCFLTSLKYAKAGTKILFDDYTDRPHYHIVEKYVTRVQECRSQCLFIVPDKSKINLNELDQDIAAFRNVMD